jgi:hypothetical protein
MAIEKLAARPTTKREEDIAAAKAVLPARVYLRCPDRRRDTPRALHKSSQIESGVLLSFSQKASSDGEPLSAKRWSRPTISWYC